jgi:hypothetical protein
MLLARQGDATLERIAPGRSDDVADEQQIEAI